MFKKKYLGLVILLILILFSNAHSTQHYNFRSASEREQRNNDDDYEERKKEQERREQEARERALAEELAKQNEAAEVQKSAVSIHEGLALLNNKEEKSAIAVFEIPSQSEQYILSDVQKERAKEMFEVYANYNRGSHKVIKFRYADPSVLPQTRDQAILLLYSPYIKMNIEEFKNFSGRTDCPLNEAQKKIIYKKVAQTQAIIDRAKAEYEKTKESLGSQTKLDLKEGFIGSTVIKTDTGHCRISDIKIGQVVCCYDAKSGKETHSKITYVDKIRVEDHIQLIINDEIIRVAPDHKFYVSSSDAWVPAHDLKDNVELRQLVDPRIQDVKKVAEALDVIRIAVDEKQNFYITEHNILVHNFIIEASLMWGAGAGTAFSWAIIKPTLAAIGVGVVAYLGHKLTEKGLKDAIYRERDLQRLEENMLKCFPPGVKPNAIYMDFADGGKANVIYDASQNNKNLTFHQEQTKKIEETPKPTKDTDAQAPGKPTEADGFVPPKNWDGEKVKSPNGKGYGWPDKKGKVWVPTGPKGHGGAHWDVQHPDGSYENIVPGGRVRGQK